MKCIYYGLCLFTKNFRTKLNFLYYLPHHYKLINCNLTFLNKLISVLKGLVFYSSWLLQHVLPWFSTFVLFFGILTWHLHARFSTCKLGLYIISTNFIALDFSRLFICCCPEKRAVYLDNVMLTMNVSLYVIINCSQNYLKNL